MDAPFLFLLASLAVLLSPGPTNTLLATSGATVGFRRAVHLLSAELAGYAISITAIATISTLHPSTPAELAVLRLAAAVYLGSLAYKLWRTRLAASKAHVGWRQVFVTTLLNPKALIFALVIIPIHSSLAPAYILALFPIISLVGTMWISGGTLVGHAAGSRCAAIVPRAASVWLGVLATGLIVSAFSH